MRDLSVGDEDDIFMVPNIPLIGALAKTKDADPLTKMGFNGILTTSRPRQFHTKTVKEFLFGYSDNFIEMLPNVEAKQAGLISGRKGSMICTCVETKLIKNLYFQVSRLTT